MTVTDSKCEICAAKTNNPLCVKCAAGLRYTTYMCGMPIRICICCERTFANGFWWSDKSEDVIVCKKCHEDSLNESDGDSDVR